MLFRLSVSKCQLSLPTDFWILTERVKCHHHIGDISLQISKWFLPAVSYYIKQHRRWWILANIYKPVPKKLNKRDWTSENCPPERTKASLILHRVSSSPAGSFEGYNSCCYCKGLTSKSGYLSSGLLVRMHSAGEWEQRLGMSSRKKYE